MVGILLPEYSEYTKEFYEARGFNTYKVNGNQMGITLNYPCPHLKPNGCDIYETRPGVCRDYDGRQHALMKDKCLWIYRT